MNYKIAQLIKPGQFAHSQKESDGLSPHEILVKVNFCAICGSDLRIFKHGNERIAYPVVIGHEVSGTVVETRHNDYYKGQRVGIGADIPCGECIRCKSGKPNLCMINLAIGYQLQGGFAEYMILDKTLLNHGPIVKVGSNLTSEVLCLGEPVACAINGIEKINLESKSRVLIFGGGPIGIMIGYLSKKYHDAANIVYIEPSNERKNFLLKCNFVSEILDPSVCESMVKNGRKFDAIFTCCSVPKVHEYAVKLVDKGGRVNFFGGLAKPSPEIAIITNNLHYDEITLTGSHGSTPKQHKKACEYLEENEEFFASLISKIYPLEKINEAFDEALSGKSLKILVKP